MFVRLRPSGGRKMRKSKDSSRGLHPVENKKAQETRLGNKQESAERSWLTNCKLLDSFLVIWML